MLPPVVPSPRFLSCSSLQLFSHGSQLRLGNSVVISKWLGLLRSDIGLCEVRPCVRMQRSALQGTDTVQFNWECRAFGSQFTQTIWGRGLTVCRHWKSVLYSEGSKKRGVNSNLHVHVHVPYRASTMESILLLYCTVQAIA